MANGAPAHLRLVPQIDEVKDVFTGTFAKDLERVYSAKRINIRSMYEHCNSFPAKRDQGETFVEFVEANSMVFDRYFRIADGKANISEMYEVVNYLQMLVYLKLMMNKASDRLDMHKKRLFLGSIEVCIVRSDLSDLVDRILTEIDCTANLKVSNTTPSNDSQRLIDHFHQAAALVVNK